MQVVVGSMLLIGLLAFGFGVTMTFHLRRLTGVGDVLMRAPALRGPTADVVRHLLMAQHGLGEVRGGLLLRAEEELRSGAALASAPAFDRWCLRLHVIRWFLRGDARAHVDQAARFAVILRQNAQETIWT